ncbi:DUF1028 domain-containing protein [candidate division KSB1 bacterium]
MKKHCLLLLMFVLVLTGTSRATFSIVAADPATGQVGAAVASRAFGVGNIVTWVQGNIGAVCTQCDANRAYGPKGLSLLAEGKSPREVVEFLIGADDGRDVRQLGIIDSKGNSFGYTGSKAPNWAGVNPGLNVQAQGNTLAGEEVVNAMVTAYQAASGDMGNKLIAALEAGQAAGGDWRGQQAAAVVVSGTRPDDYGHYQQLYDLRVDDHPHAIAELRRLYRYLRATWSTYGVRREWRKDKNTERAVREVEAIAAQYPEAALVHYELACYFSLEGMIDRAVIALGNCLRLHPTYRYGAGNDENFERMIPEVFKRIESTTAKAP